MTLLSFLFLCLRHFEMGRGGGWGCDEPILFEADSSEVAGSIPGYAVRHWHHQGRHEQSPGAYRVSGMMPFRQERSREVVMFCVKIWRSSKSPLIKVFRATLQICSTVEYNVTCLGTGQLLHAFLYLNY